MFQHHFDLNASHYQHEALRDAENRRLVHEAQGHGRPAHSTELQRRVMAVAIAVVTVLGVVALI